MKNTLPLSSFPLQILLTFEVVYIPIMSLLFFLLLLFKTHNLAYTSAMSAQQGIILTLFICISIIRIQQGIGANKTEDSLRMTFFNLLALLGIVFGIYFIVIQYYVLLIELIMSIIIIVVNIFQIIFGFFSCWQFQSYEKSQ